MSSTQPGSRWMRIGTLARHEYRSAVRSRILSLLIGILIVVTIVSVYIAAVEYRSQVADYEAYRSAAVASGLERIAPSPLMPLALLRGAMEYLEMIGAIIAIALGYLTVARERASRTLPLLRTRPVTTGELTAGNLLGAVAVFATIVAAVTAVAVLCVGLIGNDWIGGAQIVKLLLAYLSAIVYLMAFYCLGAALTAGSRVGINGLIVALGVWVLVVLVIPQIGDTLDADNQLPGGLFKALGLGKPDEDAVLLKFATYERVRTGIEEASFAQHFQRFAFAMTDVKERYRGWSLGALLTEKRHDLIWLAVYPTLAVAWLRRALHRQHTIPQGGSQ